MAAQENLSKLLARDKRSRAVLEETRSSLVEQHDKERTALAQQLERAAADVASLQQRVELLLEKNGRLEERVAHLSDDCAAVRQRNEKQERELVQLQENAAAASVASCVMNDALATAVRESEKHRKEAASLALTMAELRSLVQVR